MAQRHEKAARLLQLALRLSENEIGRSLEELAADLGVGRRTVERMRDALKSVFGDELRYRDDEDGARRFFLAKIPPRFVRPTADELADLQVAARLLRASGHDARAASLDSLATKLAAVTASSERRRLPPDVEALVEAEAVAASVGPGPNVDPTVMATFREAILKGRRLRFVYKPRRRVVERVTLSPLGLVFGRRPQLVGLRPRAQEPSQYRTDRIFKIVVDDTTFAKPEGFSIADYAARSFGTGQADAEQHVVLRFDPKAAPDAENWHFHPTQAITHEPDGGLRVELRCRGMLELAWHLFTWGPNVEIQAPTILKRVLVGECIRQLERHAPGSVQPSAIASHAPPGTTWETYGPGIGQP
jgi:predicted DNA-binding transcriptional regulator YafY